MDDTTSFRRLLRRQARNSSAVMILLILGILLTLLQKQLIPDRNFLLMTINATAMDLKPQNISSSSMIPTRVSPAPPSPPPPPPPPRNSDKTNTDTKKKVNVYLLMGQSNMVGFGKVSNDAKKKYPFFATKDTETNKVSWKRVLHDDNDNDNDNDNGMEKDNRNSTDTDGAHFRRRVRYVYASGSEPESKLRIEKDMWLTMKNKKAVGPEIGIGYELGMATMTDSNNDDILLLKSCVGNRALGWDLLPPGSPSFFEEREDEEKNVTGWHYATYDDS